LPDQEEPLALLGPERPGQRDRGRGRAAP